MPIRPSAPKGRICPGWLDAAWPWVALAAAAWVGFRWIGESGAGFEFTDEGLYFLAAQDPWKNIHSTHFGFFLHPLYELAGRSPGIYRCLALLVLLGAAWVCAGAWRSWQRLGKDDTGFAHAATALILSGALLVFSNGRRTPAYDYLVFLGALLGWAGFFRIDASRGRDHGGWILMAVGLLVAAFGKWVVALVMTGLFAALISARNVPGRSGLRTFCTVWAVGLATAYFWIGSEALVLSWRESRFIVEELGSHGTHLLSYYGLTLANFLYRSLRAFAYGLPVLLLWWWLRQSKVGRPIIPTAWAGFLPWVILPAGLYFGLARAGASSFSRVGSNVMAELLWVAVMAWVLRARVAWPSASTALLLTPFLLGMGTGTALGDYAGHGAVFFQIIILGVWLGLRRSGLSSALIVPCLWLSVVLNLCRAEASLRDPFRTQPPEACRELWKIPGAGTVQLDVSQRELLGQLQARLGAAGFRPGDPLVAIGDMPGVVYLLGGWSPGTCWYFASTPQQEPYVRAVLGAVSAEVRSRSFVVIRENSPLFVRRRPILELTGGNRPADFVTAPLSLADSPTRFHGWSPSPR